ncbi:MAG TPA: CoA transferase [Thermoanaerobaculia bacterium]|nr:CoA transferase [Thermoanaerobaculia bacterium]
MPDHPLATDHAAALDDHLPLDGVLVADFSRILAGPLCTMMLGDAGARVIKVEPPGGDETRRWGPPFVAGESTYFLSVNRNKESIVLDLKREGGIEAARRLIQRADVVVENFKDADRLRFGFEAGALQALSPGAVVCSIRGFDRDAADAALPGYDLLAQAAGGLMAITGEPDGPPVKAGVALSDVLTAHYAHGAILAALYAREKTGRGSAIEVSLFGATVASLVNVAQAFLLTGEEPRRYGTAHPSIVPYQTFAAADRSFALAVASDRHFERFARDVLERDDLARDPRFVTNAGRVTHRGTLIAEIEETIRRRTAAEWIERCRRAAIPAALVERFEEIFARPLVQTVEHPAIGPLPLVRSPLRTTAGAPRPLPPPRLGEHSRSVLRFLDLPETSADDVA